MRIWAICALAVGAIVAASLFLSQDADEVDASAPDRAPRAPAPLSEAELRTYVEVAPQFYAVLGRAAMEFQAGRVRGGGSDAGAAQAAVDALLQRYQLTRETWGQLMARVEYAVSVVREEARADERGKEIGKKIALKRELLEMTTGQQREVLEQDIEALEAQLTRAGAPLSDRDRRQVVQLWKDLDPVVPAPPK